MSSARAAFLFYLIASSITLASPSPQGTPVIASNQSLVHNNEVSLLGYAKTACRTISGPNPWISPIIIPSTNNQGATRQNDDLDAANSTGNSGSLLHTSHLPLNTSRPAPTGSAYCNWLAVYNFTQHRLKGTIKLPWILLDAVDEHSYFFSWKLSFGAVGTLWVRHEGQKTWQLKQSFPMFRLGSLKYKMQARGHVSFDVEIYPTPNGQTGELSLFQIVSPLGTTMETVAED